MWATQGGKRTERRNGIGRVSERERRQQTNNIGKILIIVGSDSSLFQSTFMYVDIFHNKNV